VLVYTLLRQLAYSPAAAIGIVATVSLSLLLAVALYARMVWSASFPRPVTRWIICLLWAVPGGTLAAAVAAGLLRLGPVPIILAALAGGTVVARQAAVALRSSRDREVQVPRLPDNLQPPRDVDPVIADCRRVLLSARLSEDQRCATTINLADALIWRTMLSKGDDGLPEAVELLRGVLARPATDPAFQFIAAKGLVGAMSLKGETRGDFEGYAEAVELQLHAARSMQKDSPALAIAHADAADLHLALARDPSTPTGQEHVRAGLESVRAGLDACPPRYVGWRLALESKANVFLSVDRADGLDAAIDHCRRVRAQVRTSVADRAPLDMTLATLLSNRAELRQATTRADLDESEAICRELIRTADETLRGPAMRLLARILALRDHLRHQPCPR
jgi:hypothetical protein